MIRTVRDAESQIGLIQREITYLKTKIQNLETQVNELEDTPSTVISSAVPHDSILSADGSTISHRLFHIFEKIKVKILEVTQALTVTGDLDVTGNIDITGDLDVSGDIDVGGDLDVTDDLDVGGDITATGDLIADEVRALKGIFRNNGTGSQVHLSDVLTGDVGTYLTNIGDNTWLCSGCERVGGDFVARATSACVVAFHTTAGIRIFYNSGLTPGNIFAQTLVAVITPAGEFSGTNGVFTGNITAASGTVYAINFEATGIYKSLGNWGITEAADTVIKTVSANTTALNYKDHAGVNQTMNVVTSLSTTTKTLAFDGGLRTT